MFKSVAFRTGWSHFCKAYAARRELALLLDTHYHLWWLAFMLLHGEPWKSIRAIKSVRYLKTGYQYHRLRVYHRLKSSWEYWFMKGPVDAQLRIPSRWVTPVLIEMYFEYKESIEIRFDEYVVKLRNQGDVFREDAKHRNEFDLIVRKICQLSTSLEKS